MKPYLIGKSTLLVAHPPLVHQSFYDDQKQLWIDSSSGIPIVDTTNKKRKKLASDFGETTMTKTQEGTDQSEILQASDFGETSITETHEGTDQSEVLRASDMGETIQTNTGEGSDVLS